MTEIHETTQESIYGYKALRRIPEKMSPWDLVYVMPPKSIFVGEGAGVYELVRVQAAGVEMHHEVDVVDENGDPLPDVLVMIGYPGGGPDLSRYMPLENYWPQSPAVLMGNAQYTDMAGRVKHTYRSGGEDIWIWDIGEDKVLKATSAIVKNCKWVTEKIGMFNHTGVRLRFQRRLDGRLPKLQEFQNLQSQLIYQARLIAHLAAETGINISAIT